MDTYFGDLNEGTHVIADDVKIHGQDEATHNKHLIQVLNQCRKVGLKLNAEKCIFKSESHTILWSCNFQRGNQTRFQED